LGEETKPFFLTSEFWVALLMAVALFIGSSASNFNGPLMWTLVTVIAAAYVVSRGLAKGGSRYFDRDRDSRWAGRWSAEGAEVALLWILVVLLVIFAIAGGVTLSNFLWLLLVVAAIVALVSLFAY
jgi:hypothetical protein